MNDDDSKRIIGFYEDTLNTYGNDARSVHWADTETQRVRFEVLNGVAALGNKSVLDVGCGYGFYSLIAERLVPAFVDRARERFPGAVFSVEDIFSVRGEYDYVLASGALNFMVADSKQYYFSMIKKMFELSKKGLAFNMLNNAEHPTDDTLVSYDIDEVTAYCKTLSDHVVMTRGYLPWDFTVYMYKE